MNSWTVVSEKSECSKKGLKCFYSSLCCFTSEETKVSNLNLVSKEKKGPNNHYKGNDEAEVLSVCSSSALPFDCYELL